MNAKQWKERRDGHRLELGNDLIHVDVYAIDDYMLIRVHGWTDFTERVKGMSLDEAKMFAENKARELLRRALEDVPAQPTASVSGQEQK